VVKINFCNEVKEDASAYAICNYLVESYGVTKDEFDVGVASTVHNTDKNPTLTREKPNGRVEPAEVYEKAIEFAEREEGKNLKRLIASDFRNTSFKFQSPLLKFLALEGDMKIAWLFDDLDSKSETDSKLFVRVNKDVKGIREKLIADGMKDGSPEFERALVREIAMYIKDPSNREDPSNKENPSDKETPSDRGGLGIKFDFHQKEPEKKVVETIKGGRGTCSECTKVFMALARLAGLKDVHPVELYVNDFGIPVHHSRACVILSNGEEVHVELSYKNPILDEKIVSGGRFSIISRLDFLGYHYNNVHWLNPHRRNKRERRGKETLLERALDFSPRNYRLLNNYGIFLYENNQAGLSIEYFIKSQEINPQFHDVYYWLSMAHKAVGKVDEAKGYCDKYEKMSNNSDCR